jgi:hypothetical protein
VNLADKFDLIDDYWQPRVVGSLNGSLVKLAKLNDLTRTEIETI